MAKSEVSHAQLDRNTRLKKAAKIISVLRSQRDLFSCTVLDIGTGSGYIAHALSRQADSVTSVDLYDERREKQGFHFVQVKDERLPFSDGSFDVVITNHVIEHMPDQRTHLREIYRVLKKGGMVYLATPNKFWLTDPHHKLPFISWLPRSLATPYLKFFKNREWDIYPLSYWRLKKMTRRFSFTHFTPFIVKHSQQFNLKIPPLLRPLFSLIPLWALGLLTPFYPTYVVLLRKK